MKKRLLFTTLVFSLIFVIVIYGCNTKESEVPEEVQEKIEQTGIQEQTTEKEANNLTDITPQKQDVILNQSPIQETKVREIKAQKPTCSREFSPQFNAEPYYSGPLFDAHFHMPPTYDEEQEKGWRYPVWGKEITLAQILCYFDKEKVRGAITFNFWEYENLEQSILNTAEMKKQLPLGIHLFLIPSELLAEELDEIVTSHKGVYDGFGEIVFYDPERPGATPDDPVSLEINKVAAKHGLIVMFHPGKNQKSKIENALQKNPDTKFLLHGYESEDYISELMDKYPNVYYSIDSATLYNFDGALIMGPKERFVSRFKREFNSILNNKVAKWKPQIEKHPDRFMWGTDRAADWHFNEEISILFEEFARAFTGRLSPEVQEKYAYENAERLLQER